MRKLPLYGLMAEFDEPEALKAAARRAYEEGYRKMDAYSRCRWRAFAESLGFRHTRVPLIVLIGGIVGCLSGFYLQYWISVID